MSEKNFEKQGKIKIVLFRPWFLAHLIVLHTKMHSPSNIGNLNIKQRPVHKTNFAYLEKLAYHANPYPWGIV
jgi:hypothetical protein